MHCNMSSLIKFIILFFSKSLLYCECSVFSPTQGLTMCSCSKIYIYTNFPPLHFFSFLLLSFSPFLSFLCSLFLPKMAAEQRASILCYIYIPIPLPHCFLRRVFFHNIIYLPFYYIYTQTEFK